MKTFIIEQVSNNRTIHDLSSPHFDRDIKFRKGTKYAVVLAAYYGGNLYTTHKTAKAAIAMSEKSGEWSHEIIDDEGFVLVENARGELERHHNLDWK